MASPSYSSLLRHAGLYLDPAKAGEVLMRQLEKCELDPNTLSIGDIRGVESRLATVLGLYVSDGGKREELKRSLSALA